MTVKLASNTAKHYQGASTDDKPASQPEGSTYHAIDTGVHYIYHNDMWVPDLTLIAALRAV